VADQPVNPSLDPVTAASRVADSDPVEAERLLRSIVEKDPRSLEAHTNLGLLLVRAGRASEAVPYLAVAARVEPTRWLYRFNHAQALGAAGHWAAAIEEYRAAADLSPSDYPTRFNLAMALWRAGDAAAAVTAFEAALALDKTHAPAHLVLGQALERLGRVNAAVDAYDRYLELAPLASDADAVKRRIARLKSQPAAPAS
jgi:tetratricopeptide (TPR) repeat protein